MSTIIIRDTKETSWSIIISKYAVILSHREKLADPEFEYDQIGLRDTLLDDTIVVLTAIRNAKLLGVTVEELWKYESGLGGGFYIGVKGARYSPPYADMELFTILYMANQISFEGKIVYHSYSAQIGDKIRAATKHLEKFPVVQV